MLPAMMPTVLPVSHGADPDDPDVLSSDEAEPLVLLEDPLEDRFEVVPTIVVNFEKLMLGVLVVELEPYMYDVVPDGGDEGSAHTTLTDSTRAWK